MIRHVLNGPPARRIAVIQIPRAQASRLGWIRSQNWIAGPNTSALNSWTPVRDLAPTLAAHDSSLTPESWQALILQRQQIANLRTPGTLEYVPAPSPPSGATIVAPWNTWSTEDCNPLSGSIAVTGAPSPAAAAASAASGMNYNSDRGWIIVAGILGAAASLMYLSQSSKGKS